MIDVTEQKLALAVEALEWINRNATEVDVIDIIHCVNDALKEIEEADANR